MAFNYATCNCYTALFVTGTLLLYSMYNINLKLCGMFFFRQTYSNTLQ